MKDKNSNPNHSEYFGEEAKMYMKMLKMGEILSILGLPLTVLGYTLFIYLLLQTIGIILLFIGVILLLTGYMGYKEEAEKRGIRKVYTKSGIVSIFTGIISVFVMYYPYLSIVLGIIAVITGKRGMNKRDNTYASAGVISGIVGIAGSAIILGLFYFSKQG